MKIRLININWISYIKDIMILLGIKKIFFYKIIDNNDLYMILYGGMV